MEPPQGSAGANVPKEVVGDRVPSPIEYLPLGDRLSWFSDLLGGMFVGGVYLLAGQIVLELGAVGVRTVTILTEEAERRFYQRATLLTGDWSQEEAKRAIAHARCDGSISSLDQLPGFILREVLNNHGRYGGSKLVVLDSVQGHATSGSALAAYRRLFEFDQLARAAGVTVLLINQLTKTQRLAGPRAVEHHADAVVRLAKLGQFRVIELSKNRFGPAPRTCALLIDPATTALKPSPHADAMTGTARTFVSNLVGPADIQAAVSLPMSGSRPTITSPGLPRKRIELIINAIGGLPMLDLGTFSMNVAALMPGDTPFRGWLSLALAVALISSCLRRAVPSNLLFIGEVDLDRAIRPAPPIVLESLATTLAEGLHINAVKIVGPAVTAHHLPSGAGVELIACETLDQVVYRVWPDTH